jgi:hypothetical protein
MTRGYIVGTGYFKANQKCEDFFSDCWVPNTLKYASPEKIIVTNSASPEIPTEPLVEWLNLSRNPGHWSPTPSRFAGWSFGFIQGALYAYAGDCDYIYKEQDCLAFGNWVEEMQRQCEGKGMVTGELWEPHVRWVTMELSLIFVKWEFIMPFLTQLFSIEETEDVMRPEKKFLAIRDKNPDSIGAVSFGYGGNRPFNCEDDCFYIQRPRWNYQTKQEIASKPDSGVAQEEIALLQEKGLL